MFIGFYPLKLMRFKTCKDESKIIKSKISDFYFLSFEHEALGLFNGIDSKLKNNLFLVLMRTLGTRKKRMTQERYEAFPLRTLGTRKTGMTQERHDIHSQRRRWEREKSS